MIVFPKGVNARDASLKCCFAKGIPTMVMPRRIPITMCERLIQTPPIRIQIKFIKVYKPEDVSWFSIFFPKGHRANSASFKVWMPKGIPIMVIIKMRLAMKYSIAIKSPPKTSHSTFPSNFMRR